jgi:CoA:oxalate CoA-transferase
VKQPLTDVRVLDLSRLLSGPFCTMLMADLGAEVIKVEKPLLGDPARELGPRVGGDSAYFISVNRGKKSITLDLASEEGRRIILELIPHFDVLVENFVPGTMDRLGLGYETVNKRNPRIIYASISGFGQDGPYAVRPALDVIVQAMGGIMSVTGEQGGPPIRPGASLGDSVAGLFTALAVVSALYERYMTGQGTHIDMSMLDCQVTMMENAFARYFATRQVPGPLGTRHPAATPFQEFCATDGYFVVALLTDDIAIWIRFCEVIDRSDLAHDPRFSTNQGRTDHYVDLERQLRTTFAQNSVAFWLEALLDAGIPCGPVKDIEQVIEDPQVRHRGMLASIPHKKKGKWIVANTPFRMGTRVFRPVGPSPDLGEHTAEVLHDVLGMTEREEANLRENGTT